MKKLSLIMVTILVLLQSCNQKQSSHSKSNSSDEVKVLFEEFYEDILKIAPMAATVLGDNRYNDLFIDEYTQEYKSKFKVIMTEYIDKATLINRNNLSETDKLNLDRFVLMCDSYFKYYEYYPELTPINQLSSFLLKFATWATPGNVQPFNNSQDYYNWIKRLDGFVVACDTLVENMRRGIRMGMILPKCIVLKMIPQLKDIIGDPVEENIFLNPVKAFPDNISETDREKLREVYLIKIKNEIIPAYKKVHDFLLNEYLPVSRETVGLCSVPGGDEYYKFLINYYTSTDYTPDEIYEIGINEVERISEEIEKIRIETGFVGNKEDFFNFIRNKKELMPFDKPEQVIDHFIQIQKTVNDNLKLLFDRFPETQLEIRRTEEFRERTASPEYRLGLADGSRPGIFYIPIPDVKSYNIYQDEDLFLHEAIPGHYYQMSLQMEDIDIPKFAILINSEAYTEGWALYSELLGKELGLYNDPYQYLGMLSNQMHRALRLVVDVGIHSKGWSRDKAINYMLENEPESEQNIVTEVERYIAIPGQALSYKVGQIKILQLKAMAESELGVDFNIKEFHDVILETGSIQLSLLEKRIDSWIINKKNSI